MNNGFIHKLSVVFIELLKKFTSHFDFQQSLVIDIKIPSIIDVNQNPTQLITSPQLYSVFNKIIFISVIRFSHVFLFYKNLLLTDNLFNFYFNRKITYICDKRSLLYIYYCPRYICLKLMLN